MRGELIEYVWERLETLKELFPNIAFEKLKSIKGSGDKGEFWGQMRLVGELKPEIEANLNELYEHDYSRNVEQLEKELVVMLKKTKEKDSLEVAVHYNDLGMAYKLKGMLDKAISCYEKALEIDLNTIGENNSNTAIDYNNLGTAYISKGDHDKAISYLDKALWIYLRTAGEINPNTARAYNNLGEAYRSKNDYDKAIDYYKKALEIVLKTIGENNPHTATLYNNLGSVFGSKGDYDKAIDYYKKALEIDLKTIGESNPGTARDYNNLGEAYRSKKDYDKAIGYCEKALEITLKTIGESNPQTATHYNNLGMAYYSKSDYDKAIAYYEKSHEISVTIQGFPPKDIEQYNVNLAKAVLTQYKTFLKVHIKNFKLLEDVTIELSSGINIFIGENSSGKTSLLQALTLALLPEKYLGESNEKYESYISKGQTISEVTLEIGKYQKKLTLYSDRREIQNKFLSPFTLAYGSNIFTKDTKTVEDFVNDIINQTVRRDFADSIFSEYTDKFYNPKSILNKLRERKDENSTLINIFVETINGFIDDFKLELDDKTNQYFFRHNSQKLFRLEDLSEGYRNTIVLIGDMIAKTLGVGKTPATIEGIIIIDEFDRHLHPKWQTNLVDKLAEIFPKIQFLLTTHNPMSILGRKPEEITVLYEEDGKVKARRDIGTENIDVGTALLTYFNVDSLVGMSMQANIERFTELKLLDDLSDKEKTELKELEKKLDNTVAVNFIYNRAYFGFLRFLKVNKRINYIDYRGFSDEKMKTMMDEYKHMLEKTLLENN